MRKLTLMIMTLLLLAGCIAAAPAVARTAPAPVKATTARGSVYDPLIGNWYRGKMWFSVKSPVNGVYRVVWSNGAGTKRIRYTIQRLSDQIYYETANHRNTYTVLSNGYQVAVHYRTTEHRYITRRFSRVE
jgi:hypothetical protein